ncbi:unnamed protein product [Caenorhabditis sp. 36 PRJEB53466]|nr:unnamed protein product [Caenorhabditis sp. 36 PRJEB53466]
MKWDRLDEERRVQKIARTVGSEPDFTTLFWEKYGIILLSVKRTSWSGWMRLQIIYIFQGNRRARSTFALADEQKQ